VPRPILARLASGIRRGGLAWLAHVVRTELRSPQFAATRRLRRAVAGLDRAARRFAPRAQVAGKAGRQLRPHTLLFVFDLAAAPVTFDIATYLAGAELARRASRKADIFVAIVPGGAGRFRREETDYERVVSIVDREWRLRNLVLPCLSLLPTVSGFVLCSAREEAADWLAAAAALYPEDYLPALPTHPQARSIRDAAAAEPAIWPLFAADPVALAQVDRYFDAIAQGRPVVTISLRAYGYNPQRNSDSAAWLGFADWVREAGYCPIFVPDFAESLTSDAGATGHLVCPAAAWHLGLRMALYERAFLNLALMHGPMELCWYNERCRYLIFMPVGAAPQSSPEYLTREGFRLGEDFAFARPGQHLVWERDHPDLIRREFERMAAAILASGTGG